MKKKIIKREKTLSDFTTNAMEQAAMERYLEFEAHERENEKKNNKKRYKKHQVFKRSTHEIDLYLNEIDKEKRDAENRKSNPVRIYNEKLRQLKAYQVESPANGLINEFRVALNIPLEYIANEMGVTKQAVLNYETNEKKRILSMEILDRFAKLMGLKLIYYFVPDEKTPLQLIKEKVLDLIDDLPEKQKMSYYITNENIREQIKTEDLDKYSVEKYSGVKKQQRLFMKTIDSIPKSLWKSDKKKK
ncbi:helix-turn-helix domain-containing protein [Aurantibacillus circumpalustris]|uniref:helix-turn-helix domain-containing protein n=1 Tax=Aurantibacillus circumpalustris TaxID=3036359 RepID=UPI00295B4B76|nr:helix-turn-helix domain-containing protein [Aurantibacillus circumpalustris]